MNLEVLNNMLWERGKFYFRELAAQVLKNPVFAFFGCKDPLLGEIGAGSLFFQAYGGVP